MKIFVALLALLGASVNATSSSLAFGAEDSLPKEVKNKMRSTADFVNRRRYLTGGPPTLTEVMLKNLDCSACLEAPPAVTEEDRRLEGHRALAPNEVFVTALNCDAEDSYQLWNLLPVDASGTWYLFENKETETCMQLVGECSPDGTLYTIEMGECDPSNAKGIWGVTGVGQIVNFHCFVESFEAVSTPDVFLEAKCGPYGGVDKMDISSLSSGSDDAASNYWVVFPKTLFGEEET